MEQTRPKSVTLGSSTIGSQNWKNGTLRDIRLSQALINRCDKSCEIGRAQDPLPHIRDTLAELSNNEAHRYFREVRSIVSQLQANLLRINEEIKSLTRGKEALEKALEHRRKDIQMNRDSIDFRSARPAREKDQDGADDLLNAERQHLLNLKKTLESHLKTVQSQLQALDSTRGRLARCFRERSRVLDLACHTRSACTNSRNTPTPRPRSMDSLGSKGFPRVDPLGAFTPEVEQALREAREAKAESVKLRGDLADVIARTDQLQRAAHASVNNGLLHKVAETVTLKQHLTMSSGRTRNAINRAKRWHDATDMAHSNQLGPVSSADMTTRERLTRPLIRMYQRHPGTQVPEAQEIVKSGEGLLDSLSATAYNINLLNLAQARIHSNISDKNAAYDVDTSVLRMRRRKADHRWTVGAAF